MGVIVLALELNWLVNLGYALLAFKAKKKKIYIYIYIYPTQVFFVYDYLTTTTRLLVVYFFYFSSLLLF